MGSKGHLSYYTVHLFLNVYCVGLDVTVIDVTLRQEDKPDTLQLCLIYVVKLLNQSKLKFQQM